MNMQKYFELEIPSRRKELLFAMLGKTIAGLLRPSALTRQEATSEDNVIEPSMVFSATVGPLLIQLNTGLIVIASSDSPLRSVILGVIEDDEGNRGEYYSRFCESEESDMIDACDPVYSRKEFCDFVGSRIDSIHVLKMDPAEIRFKESPCVAGVILACESQPREAGVVLVCEGGRELLLSHGLRMPWDDFTVTLSSEIYPALRPQLKQWSLSELETDPLAVSYYERYRVIEREREAKAKAYKEAQRRSEQKGSDSPSA